LASTQNIRRCVCRHRDLRGRSLGAIMRRFIRGFYAACAVTVLCLVLADYDDNALAQDQSPTTREPLTVSSIAFIYHGVALDRDFRAITLDRTAIEQIQNSILDVLATPRPSGTPEGVAGPKRPPLLSTEVRNSQLSAFANSPDATLIAKQALIERTLRRLPSNEHEFYRERAAALKDAMNRLPEVQNARSNPNLKAFIERLGFNESGPNGTTSPAAKSYIDECAANSVPIPPNWPDAKWVIRGDLKFTFASFPNSVRTEVYTYEAPGGQGLCYALPRRNVDGAYEAIGMICQSRDSGKACFWDNIDAATDTRITGKNISLEIPKIENGFVLAENCTTCHRGVNVFMVHPDTPLGAVKGRNPKVRYTPIGQTTWSNPPAMSERGDGACSECHEIAAPNAAYCGFLAKAANMTMPPLPDTPTGWTNPGSEYKAHIDFLKSRCAAPSP
jgi:hypothetical protein